MAKKSNRYNFFISFLLFLAQNKKYNSAKKLIKDLLQNPNNRYKRYIDYFLIFLIVTSVAVFIYEVKYKIPTWLEIYAVYVTSFIFAIEYILNFWVYYDIRYDILREYNESKFVNRKPKFNKVLFKALRKNLFYVITPSAIIDLLAILPAYRSLRVLKIFVLFRFLKLLRHARNLHQFLDVLKDRRFELFTLFFMMLFIVLIGGLAIYIAEEHTNNKINDLFDAIYWSFITITTVGYGDITPLTTTGKVVSFAIIVFGIAIISFFTSVLVSAFSDKLDKMKENRLAEKIIRNDEYFIVCGYGQITKVLLNRFKADRKKNIILDANPQKVEEAIADGHNAICDNPSRYEVLKRFYNKDSKITLLALTGSDVENIYLTLNAKSISDDIEVIARASSYNMLNKYKRAGANRVVLPTEIASSMIVNSILYPTMYKAVSAILHSKDIANIDEIYVTKETTIYGKKVSEIDFEGSNIILIGVQNGINGKFIFAPKEDYKFKDEDIIIILGHKVSIEYFKNIYNIVGTYL